MDNPYENKQKYRKKEANSSKGITKYDNRPQRKIANKLSNLVGNVLADFDLIKGTSSKKYSRIASYNSEISIRTDAETDDDNIIYVTDETESSSIDIYVSQEEINNINKLAKWLPTDVELKTTPISQRYEYSRYLKPMKCYSPIDQIGDQFVYKDLQQIFKNVPDNMLIEIINYLESFPYYVFHKDGVKLVPNKACFETLFKLTPKHLLTCYNIRTEILNRSSYGVLFLRDKHFFAIKNPYGKYRKGAVKGHSILKSDGIWENPWETAVREVKEEIQYQCNSDQLWRPYDMKEHKQEFENLNYLECLFEGYTRKQYTRLIGLFIIRLKTSIKFQPKDRKEVASCNWYPINGTYKTIEFYTLDPFLRYVRRYYYE